MARTRMKRSLSAYDMVEHTPTLVLSNVAIVSARILVRRASEVVTSSSTSSNVRSVVCGETTVKGRLELELVVTDVIELELELELGDLEGKDSGMKGLGSESTDPLADLGFEKLWSESLRIEACRGDSSSTAECIDAGDMGIECLEDSLFATDPLADAVCITDRAEVVFAIELLGREGRDFSYIDGKDTPKPRFLNADCPGGRSSPYEVSEEKTEPRGNTWVVSEF